jgi:CheY-like chemotaxis protein
MRVLVVEDGHEYTETLSRFLPDVTWERAGSGPDALQKLAAGAYDAVFSDMRFDRVPDEQLLGDIAETSDQFNGDAVQARRHLQDHQGTYVLAAIRQAGHPLPVLMSYDFEGEPKRWERLKKRHGRVDYLPDQASPAEILRRLRAL